MGRRAHFWPPAQAPLQTGALPPQAGTQPQPALRDDWLQICVTLGQKPAHAAEKPAVAHKKPAVKPKSAARQSEGAVRSKAAERSKRVQTAKLAQPAKPVQRTRSAAKPRERTLVMLCTRFRTYNASSGTYRGYDGQTHSCR